MAQSCQDDPDITFRAVEREGEPSLSELLALNGNLTKELMKAISTAPSDYEHDARRLNQLARSIKTARDEFVNINRKLSGKLSDVGSKAESHHFRMQRSELLSDDYEQLNDINSLLRRLKEEEISNLDLQSVRSLPLNDNKHMTSSPLERRSPVWVYEEERYTPAPNLPSQPTYTPLTTERNYDLPEYQPVPRKFSPTHPHLSHSPSPPPRNMPIHDGNRVHPSNAALIQNYPARSHQSAEAPIHINNRFDPLAEHVLKQDLLKNIIVPFDGTAFKFNTWSNQINSRVANLNLNPQEFLHVLLANCTGEPKRMIQDILAMDIGVDDQTVTEVWNMLQDRFGSPYKAADQLRERLQRFPAIRGSRIEMAQFLQKLYDVCRVVSSYMRNCFHLDDLNTPAGQAIIRSELPDPILERWQVVGT